VTEMLAELRTEVAALELRGGRRHYPDALRARLTSAAQALRGDGASWDLVAEQLGVGASALRRWCERASDAVVVEGRPAVRGPVPVRQPQPHEL